jgi:hypothetical protein
MSESAFREKACSCHECEAVDRLREIIREKDAEILRLTKALQREQSKKGTK